MIIGTAGHIDHGKTTLVRALTGVDTDRLKEEKARGMTIELGYAYAPVSDEEILGFVDVPGHERFVHTMVAGATGIDHALLVIAADDGVMPQTREHLDILHLLGVSEGTIALSKVDRVSVERIAEVREELALFLQGSVLSNAPVFPTAANRDDDPGVGALKAYLEALARRAMPSRTDGLFRLAVDRVFTVAGRGTVVTGSVHGGAVEVGRTLRHSATGMEVRVRGIHAQSRPSERGTVHQRCALNLAGIEAQAIAPGDWIADGRALRTSQRLDVRLHLLPDVPALERRIPVHVHLGTARYVGHLASLERDRLEAGSNALVQLVLDKPAFAMAGDRFIVRNAQARRTIGGGVVVDPLGRDRGRRSVGRLAWLHLLEATISGGSPAALIAQAPFGMSRSELAWLLCLPQDRLPTFDSDVREVGSGAQDALLVTDAVWGALCDRVVVVLDLFHRTHPDEPGANGSRLRRMSGVAGACASASDALWRALLAELIGKGRLQSNGPWLHLPSHAVKFTAPEQALADRLMPEIEAGAVDPPWVRDLAAFAQAPEDQVRLLLRKLAREGRLFQVVKDLFLAPSAIRRLASLVAQLEAGSGNVGVRAADLRDATGLGRKRVVQLLEFFDGEGYTRRRRDAHVLVAAPGWPPAHE